MFGNPGDAKQWADFKLRGYPGEAERTMDRDSVASYVLGFLRASIWTVEDNLAVRCISDKPLRRIMGLFGGAIEKEESGEFLYKLHDSNRLKVLLASIEQDVVRKKLCTRALAGGLLEGNGTFSMVKSSDGFHDVGVTIILPYPYRQTLTSICHEFGGQMVRGQLIEADFTWTASRWEAAKFSRLTKPYLTYRHDEAELTRLVQTHSDLWRGRVTAEKIEVPPRVLKKQERWHERFCSLTARAETNPEQAEDVPHGTLPSDSPICGELLPAVNT